MNKDINYTLAALVPLLRMNREKVVSVEAVEDWYEEGGREYMKEVAEITYENGYRQYADIGCDANLTAVYDVIRVIQQVKPKSEKIERIVRDVYEKPDVQRWIPVTEKLPEINCSVLLSSNHGNVFIGHRDEPSTVWQITDEDGNKDWVHDPEEYGDDVDINNLPKAENCWFSVDMRRVGKRYVDFVCSVSSVDYVAKEEGIIAWKPLPKPYQPYAK